MCDQCIQTLPATRFTEANSRAGRVLHGAFDELVAVGPYSNWLRTAILEYKSGNAGIANGLANVLKRGWQILDPPPGSVVVPMPSPQVNTNRRGFDTMRQIATVCQKNGAFDASPVLAILKFRRQTQDQIGLSAQQRQDNVRQSMWALTCAPKQIVLIDDVVTTGASMREASRVLRLAGAHNVFGIALSRSSQ